MPDSTGFSDVQPFPARSRVTPGMLDRLNSCIFLLPALYLSLQSRLWSPGSVPSSMPGGRDAGTGSFLMLGLTHSVLSAFRAGRKELRLTHGKMPISRCIKLQTDLDSCSKSSCPHLYFTCMSMQTIHLP